MSNGGGSNSQTGTGQGGGNASHYPFQSAPSPQSAQQPGQLMGMQGGGPQAQQPQNPPFAQQSQGLMGFGRGNDSTLVHMSPNEVGGLQQLARLGGGSLTTNPHTGLPEAGFLESMLPMIAGIALTATGVGAPVAAGMVAAEEGIRQKDWKKGLMAGIGAYGGAGIGSALGGAGAAAGAAEGAGATSDLALGASDVSALGGNAATTAAASNAAAGGVGGLGLTSADVSSLGSNASKTAVNSQVAAGSSPSTADSFANLNRGLGSLDTKEGMTAFGNQVGKRGFMEAAAPAIYEGMNPDPVKPPAGTPARYWVPGKGYSSLFNPTTRGWNPGQFSDTAPTTGMAAGGSTDSAMAKYQAMITPGPAMAAPPPAAAMNNYLAQMAHNNATYTPPSVAPPVAGQLQPNIVGPLGNMHNPPGTNPYNPTSPTPPPTPGAPPPSSQPPGVPAYYNYLYGNYGGRRAGGGLISLMGGGSVNGPGDGVSDSVPAMIDGNQHARLAKGEFVVPARVVSELGNGSTDAGAQRLYQMMHRVEAARKRVPMAGDSRAYGNLPA